MTEDENGQTRKHAESLKASEVLWDVRCEGSCVPAVLIHLREGGRQVEKVCLCPAFLPFGNLFPVLCALVMVQNTKKREFFCTLRQAEAWWARLPD